MGFNESRYTFILTVNVNKDQYEPVQIAVQYDINYQLGNYQLSANETTLLTLPVRSSLRIICLFQLFVSKRCLLNDSRRRFGLRLYCSDPQLRDHWKFCIFCVMSRTFCSVGCNLQFKALSPDLNNEGGRGGTPERKEAEIAKNGICEVSRRIENWHWENQSGKYDCSSGCRKVCRRKDALPVEKWAEQEITFWKLVTFLSMTFRSWYHSNTLRWIEVHRFCLVWYKGRYSHYYRNR